MATGGDSALGGDDYDRALADWALQQLGESADDAIDKAAVLIAARSCKEALSGAESAGFEMVLAGVAVSLMVSRTDFEQASAALTARALAAVRKTLATVALEDATHAHSRYRVEILATYAAAATKP